MKDKIIIAINEMGENPTIKNMYVVAEIAKKGKLSNEYIAYLATKLAKSGIILFEEDNYEFVDIASTGGPTSLTTLLCPLLLNAEGMKIPKLGVPGRPAGGIDVLSQIPNYNINPNVEIIKTIIKHSGYVHFLTNKNFVPLDEVFFKFRQENGYQSIPALVIASILSKKLSVNLKITGLDVRVSKHGNFGPTWKEAKINAIRFCEVAYILGIKTKCFLTNGEIPFQPYIGRSESLMAIYDLLNTKICDRLRSHLYLCSRIAGSLIDKDITSNVISNIAIAFEKNILAQGSKISLFNEFVKKKKILHKYIITSRSEGILLIDIKIIRDILVKLQNSAKVNTNSFPDPAGLILHKFTGDYIKYGELLASVRIERESFSDYEDEFYKAFSLKENSPFENFYEEINNA